MQAQITKGTLLGEVSSKAVTQTIKEITPFGVRLEINELGQFAGTFTASHNVTSTVYVKTDGTYDWDSKAMLSTNEGDIILGNGHGTGKMTGPKSHAGDGEGFFVTQSPKLSWLNNRKVRIEFTSDMATGETHDRFYAL